MLVDVSIDDVFDLHIVHALITYSDWGYRYRCGEVTNLSISWIRSRRSTRFLTCLFCIASKRTGREVRLDLARTRPFWADR